MSYSSLRKCLIDLDRTDQLIRITEVVDPNLVIAEIHRRVFDVGGPALLFENVKGSPFEAASNIYGTFARTEYLFRDTLPKVKRLVQAKADPAALISKPITAAQTGIGALKALPRKVRSPLSGFRQTRISELPQIISWPRDGGPFVTAPQVFTLPPGSRKIMESNVGMYRVQLGGNAYETDREVGMHYQLHRGIGVHHTMYNAADEPFRASVFIGGPPSHTFSAIMPLPEGLSELTFAGLLADRRFRYGFHDGHVISCDADFVITGRILKNVKKPEGPFGDHLGYYSLEHDFPVMEIDGVYHRKDPIWLFTVVGRPPQEDSSFGHLIHEIVGPLLPQEFPGVKEVNAVDAAGVHPLLLAIGSERYMPFRDPRPEEILTMANHLLGKGQTSLAKYLWIANGADDERISTHDIRGFFEHMLKRVDFRRDLHFQTKTTIDTLDYSGSGWNEGSKLIVAACGPEIRTLRTELPGGTSLPKSVADAHTVFPGVLAIQMTRYTDAENAQREMASLAAELSQDVFRGFPLVVVCDDSDFTAATLNNFLWVTFTRSNPSHDTYGVNASVRNKHWGCDAPLIIDARSKPHHAPELQTTPAAISAADEVIRRTPGLMKLGI